MTLLSLHDPPRRSRSGCVPLQQSHVARPFAVEYPLINVRPEHCSRLRRPFPRPIQEMDGPITGTTPKNHPIVDIAEPRPATVRRPIRDLRRRRSGPVIAACFLGNAATTRTARSEHPVRSRRTGSSAAGGCCQLRQPRALLHAPPLWPGCSTLRPDPKCLEAGGARAVALVLLDTDACAAQSRWCWDSVPRVCARQPRSPGTDVDRRQAAAQQVCIVPTTLVGGVCVSG